MKKNFLAILIGLLVGLISTIPAFSLTPYDDFSGAFIDKAKWADGEFVREIVGQELVSKVAAPNSNDSTGINVGTGRTYRWANNGLNFSNPGSVNSIQADVSVLEVSHTNPTWDTRAMLTGRWYNDGGAGTVGGGDIWAAVFIGAASRLPDGTVTLKARWEVTRMMNLDGTAWTGIAGGDIPITVSPGTPYTLFIGYDDVAKQFTFKIGNETKTFGTADGLPAQVGDANLPFKALRTRVWLYGSNESGYISATFANVYTNGTLYDNFSLPYIDQTKWSTYEYVREISGGKLRTKIRSSLGSTSTIESRPSFVDPSSINVIQTNITPIAYENCAGCVTTLGSRIYGRFYHDANATAPGNVYTGEVGAQVGIDVRGSTLTGYWLVNRAENEALTSYTPLGSGTFTTIPAVGNPYPIFLGWDGTQFTFKFNGEVQTYIPDPTTVTSPNRPYKQLSSRMFLPNGKEAAIEALFDDVMVNGIVVTPQFLDFGAVASNTYSDRAVKVVNNSSNSVTINPITSLSPPFSILSNNCATLALGGSCNIVVRFSPIGPGQFKSIFSGSRSLDPDERSISVRLNGTGLSAPAPVAGGCYHSMVLELDGSLWAWGGNTHGQLGLGFSGVNQNSPQPVGSATDWVAVSAGCLFSVALKSDGTVWSWGYDDGVLGVGPPPYTDTNSPTQILDDANGYSFDNVIAISAGSNHTLALKSNGTLWAWGWNTLGQTGLGIIGPTLTVSPTQVGSSNDWVAIAAGERGTSFALKSNGELWAWGDNGCGQLGLGTSATYEITPQRVGSANDWVAIAGGAFHSLAVKSNGTLWAWGCNDYGQLGLGPLPGTNTPTQVGNDTDWYAVSGGSSHTVAIKSNGSLWTCGDNQYGQLGNGSNTNIPINSTLVPITTDAYTNPFGNLIAIKAGRDYNVALKNDKTVWTWAHNDSGQLGDGTGGIGSDKYTPEKVFKLKLPTTTAYPAGGTYGSAQYVTLIADDPEATIYYTTNGSAPNPGPPLGLGTTQYSAPITISSSTTIKFLARETFGAPPPAIPTLYSDEAPKTEVYTITNLTAAVQAPATVGTNGPILVTATFTNNTGASIQTIRPDCFNTTFEVKDTSNSLLPSRCWVGAPYGIPDDVITIAPGGSYPVTCDISGRYDPEVLVPGTYTVGSTYTNYIQDPDTLPDGTCNPPSCYPLFKGSITSAEIPVTVQTGFLITPSHGLNGTISPSTPQVVSQGGSATFTITPDAGFQIADVLVDGISQEPVSTFNFTGVDRSHTINATFTIKIYTITATAGAHGAISPSGAVIVNYGGNKRFDITPDTGYHIVDVKVDGHRKGPINNYTFTNVNANHKIEATFAINTYIIIAAADFHGKISPFGVVLLNYDKSKTFTITPGKGYHVLNVYVDGKSVGAVTSYTFTHVTDCHIIFATFAKNK